MRPIRLEVEGFSCYRERQTPLDFTGLSLFAIAGPTGAGKSSILDAMLYALYGEIPRLGAQGRTEIISQGRDTVSVLLDFEVQGRQYRITRRVKRRAKSAAQSVATLAEITSGTERSMADGVRDVNAAVTSLLGLSYEDFTQTVVLPQGEFARFLQAEPRGQREILQRLLRHEVFERMRLAADDRRRQLESERQRIEGQLDRCADATEEALAVQESQLATARTRLAEQTGDKTTAEEACERVRRGREATVAIQRCRADWTALAAQADAIEQARREYADARRAATIVPRLDASGDAAKRLETTRQAHVAAQAAAARAEADRRDADARFTTAATDALTCDDLGQQIRRLDEIAGEITRRAELAATVAKLPKIVAAAERAVAEATRHEKTAAGAVEELAAQLRTLEGEFVEVAFDTDLFARLEALRDAGAHARALDRERATVDEELTRCEAARTGAGRTLDELRVVERKAQRVAATATAARESARMARDEGIDRHRAAALRSHLHVGEACPVCLHTVAELPPVETSPELATLEDALRETEKRAQKADASLSKAAAALAAGQARLADVAAAVERAAARREASVAACSAAFGEITAAVAGGHDLLPGLELIDWIDGRRAELTEAKAVRDRLSHRQRDIEKAHADAALAHARASAAVEQAEARLTAVRDEQARIQADLAAVVGRIEAVSTSPDPRAERDRLEREVTRLRDAERRAQEALARAEQARAAGTERVEAAGGALAEAEAHAARVQEALAAALAECGFASAADAERAVRSAEDQELLRRRIAAHDEGGAAVQQRLRELEPQVSAGEVTQEMLAMAERRRDEAAACWRQADQAVVRLDSECTRLRTSVAERQQLLAARAANERVLATTSEVATDLRSDRFQQYLLEEAFQGLVAGASVRMKSISNRYTLEWDAGEFYVVDHDNAGERRRADTLSGGETFMASLCLALQLSDEVLRTSGALRMDSLFIDEGFGTLDVDALSEVTDAMEALRHEGDRMIGVISHRPELTDRLPGCIRVHKGIGESSWHVERVG